MSDFIKIKDLTFRPYLSEAQIAARVMELAAELRRDLADLTQAPVFLTILNGSFMFAADLARAYAEDCELEFVRVASYEGTASSGLMKTLLGLKLSLKGRDVVLVEDIVDTGETMVQLLPTLRAEEPRSLRVMTLLQKPEALKHSDFRADYVGFEIPNLFVVGYGLDYDGLGRQLGAIYQLAQ